MDALDASPLEGGPTMEPRALDLLGPVAALSSEARGHAEQSAAFADRLFAREATGELGGEPPLVTRLLDRLISDDPRLGTVLDFPQFEPLFQGFSPRWSGETTVGYPAAWNLPRWQVLLRQEEQGQEGLAEVGTPSSQEEVRAGGDATRSLVHRSAIARANPLQTSPQEAVRQQAWRRRTLGRDEGQPLERRPSRSATPAAGTTRSSAAGKTAGREPVRPYPRSMGRAGGLSPQLVAERFPLQFQSLHDVAVLAEQQPTVAGRFWNDDLSSSAGGALAAPTSGVDASSVDHAGWHADLRRRAGALVRGKLPPAPEPAAQSREAASGSTPAPGWQQGMAILGDLGISRRHFASLGAAIEASHRQAEQYHAARLTRNLRPAEQPLGESVSTSSSRSGASPWPGLPGATDSSARFSRAALTSPDALPVQLFGEEVRASVAATAEQESSRGLTTDAPVQQATMAPAVPRLPLTQLRPLRQLTARAEAEPDLMPGRVSPIRNAEQSTPHQSAQAQREEFIDRIERVAKPVQEPSVPTSRPAPGVAHADSGSLALRAEQFAAEQQSEHEDWSPIIARPARLAPTMAISAADRVVALPWDSAELTAQLSDPAALPDSSAEPLQPTMAQSASARAAFVQSRTVDRELRAPRMSSVSAAAGSSPHANPQGSLIGQLLRQLGISTTLTSLAAANLAELEPGSLLSQPRAAGELRGLQGQLHRLRNPSLIASPGAKSLAEEVGRGVGSEFKAMLESIGSLLPETEWDTYRQNLAETLQRDVHPGHFQFAGGRGELVERTTDLAEYFDLRSNEQTVGGMPSDPMRSPEALRLPSFYQDPQLVRAFGTKSQLGDHIIHRRERGGQLLQDEGFMPLGSSWGAAAAAGTPANAIPRPGGLEATHGIQLDVDFALLEASDAWEAAFPGRIPYTTPRGPGEGKEEPDFKEQEPLQPMAAPLPPQPRATAKPPTSSAGRSLAHALKLDGQAAMELTNGQPSMPSLPGRSTGAGAAGMVGEQMVGGAGGLPWMGQVPGRAEPPVQGAEPALSMTLVRPIMQIVAKQAAPLLSDGGASGVKPKKILNLGEKKADYDPDKIEQLVETLYERIWELMEIEKQRRGM